MQARFPILSHGIFSFDNQIQLIRAHIFWACRDDIISMEYASSSPEPFIITEKKCRRFFSRLEDDIVCFSSSFFSDQESHFLSSHSALLLYKSLTLLLLFVYNFFPENIYAAE